MSAYLRVGDRLACLNTGMFNQIFLVLLYLITFNTKLPLTLLKQLLFPTPILATETHLFSDNFDDGDASNWVLRRSSRYYNPLLPCLNDGLPAVWQVVAGRLGIEIDGPSCSTEITPPDLDLTNVTKYRYEFDWYFPETMWMDRNVLLVWHDANNWYDLKILSNEILLQKVVGGVQYFLVGEHANFPFEANREYHFLVEVTKDKLFKVWIDGQQVLEVADVAPYITGWRTLGLQASVGGIRRSVSYFDNIEVTQLPDSPLTKLVPLIKQSDPQWAAQVYDHAPNWSQTPTIERWGCALTSMVMVMQYHGLTQLPEGQPITPESLNQWLVSQPDGYVGPGLVNWLAVTRLTKQISDVYGTPKLEFSLWKLVADAPNQQSLRDQISAQLEKDQPPIVEVPGHFLVATNVTSEDDALSDVSINDPYYDFTQLSQHQPALSLRQFTPSHTDLSYIWLGSAPFTTVEVSRENQPAAAQTHEDQIVDPVSGQTSPSLLQYWLEKPDAGTYQVSISQPEYQEFSVSILTYDQDGNVTPHTVLGWVGSHPLRHQLEYSPSSPSQLKVEYNWADLQQEVMALYKSKLMSRRAYLNLSRQVSAGKLYAQQGDQQATQRVRTQLETSMTSLKTDLKKPATETLKNRLSLLVQTP